MRSNKIQIKHKMEEDENDARDAKRQYILFQMRKKKIKS